MIEQFIHIKGARVHNLKNIEVKIQRDKFIVITGLSGSGKSSLAFDTLYAEGQRRYVESLSSYARQFLGKINKPEVDFINGIPPAIAIEQKVNTRNPRSTVGTSTEIYDYLKLLFARIGQTVSPISGQTIQRYTVTDVCKTLLNNYCNKKVSILSSIINKTSSENSKKEMLESLDLLMKMGYSRVEINGKIYKIQEISPDNFPADVKTIFLVIDRMTIKNDDDSQSRLADSVQTAFDEGKGACYIKIEEPDEENMLEFSNRFEADGISFEEPTIHTFSFNSPLGACPRCEGFGKVLGIDEDLVIPDKSLTIFEDAIACWRGDKMQEWKKRLVKNAHKFEFPVHTPFFELTSAERQLLWTGNQYFAGLNEFFEMLEKENFKIQYRVMLSRYKGKTLCPDCSGTRLKKEAGYIKINGQSLSELVLLPIEKLNVFFKNIQLSKQDFLIANRLLIEICNRLQYLEDVGLGYLTLNRLSSTLSGGESQRINLATSLGSSLVGAMYILDEPSIGLHPRDANRLIKVLKQLKAAGNTVIVVEHDEEIMQAADEIIDIGPDAGRLGGEIVFQGNLNNLNGSITNSHTINYLTGKEKIEIPKKRRHWNQYIEIIGARINNLKGINIKFPLNIFTVVTGVSGSGKSSLVKNVLFNALNYEINGYSEQVMNCIKIQGHAVNLAGVEFVDQNPIGKSTRSNPVTYVKAFDEIRTLYANTQAAKINLLTPSHFSFNVSGGRCEECQGEGIIRVEMQFMADVNLICEHCKGKRFKEDILNVKYRAKNIYDVLEMTVNEAIEFFSAETGTLERKIINKLKPLSDVGLGYVKLGQSSSTLSGGESQRVKLASFLNPNSNSLKSGSYIFIFDEPTTGLHFHDIKKLLNSMNRLIGLGHTILVIEHNLEVIKCADWIIDLGVEGGEKGGEIVFEGTPDDIINCSESFTGKYLKPKLKK